MKIYKYSFISFSYYIKIYEKDIKEYLYLKMTTQLTTRRKKYTTEEEKKEAHKEAMRRYYEKNKAKKELAKEQQSPTDKDQPQSDIISPDQSKTGHLKSVIQTNSIVIFDLRTTIVKSTKKISALEKCLADRNGDLVHRDEIIKDRDKTIKAQILEISKLKEELAYEKGQSDALKNNRPTNIVNKNCNMSSKLSNIQITTIKPFTIEHIAELVPNYTRSHFLRKHQGIVDIIVPFTTLEVDGVMERNIVCTDMSRTICHLLAEDRSWSSDNGLSICSKVVGLFIPKMIEYMKVINDTFNDARKIMDLESDKFTKSKRHADAKKIFDEYFLILEDMNPFYRAAYNKREEYDNLLRVFRDLLKPAIHIRSNRVTEV